MWGEGEGCEWEDGWVAMVMDDQTRVNMLSYASCMHSNCIAIELKSDAMQMKAG